MGVPGAGLFRKTPGVGSVPHNRATGWGGVEPERICRGSGLGISEALGGEYAPNRVSG